MIGRREEEQDAQCGKEQSAYHRHTKRSCLVAAPHETQGQGYHAYDHRCAGHEDGSKA